MTEATVTTIGSTGEYDYTSFVMWISGELGFNDTFSIGLVFPEPALKDSYERFLSDMSYNPHDYLLLGRDGLIYGYKVGDDSCLIEDDLEKLFITEPGKLDGYEGAIGRFCVDKLGGNVNINPRIYFDHELDEKQRIILPDLISINDKILNEVARDPSILQGLHHRKFEELLETLFRKRGYETQLGPGVGDEGVDLRLISRPDIGPLLILLQAKKWLDRKVGLEPVQALYGAVESEKANKGILVSTSGFLPGAEGWVRKNNLIYRLELLGMEELLKLIESATQRKN